MYTKQYFLLLLGILIFSVNCELINTRVVRKVNIDGQFVKIDTTVTIQNYGFNKIGEYIYTIEPNINEYYIKFRNENNKELTHKKMNCKNELKLSLDRKLSRDEAMNLNVEVIYIGQIVPLQKTITLTEDQFVLYTGNLFYYSSYETLSSETVYSWKEAEDLELSETPQLKHGNNLTYIYKSLEPFSFKEIKMKFKNNNPFFVVTNLERIIDVSHFGQICIQDRVSMKNAGSKLVGHYTNNSNDLIRRASNWWYTHLPAAAENVEYFDSIGNNSNSKLLHFENYKTFKFKPRYPLLSGWKTFYIISYCVPAFEYLYHDLKGRYVLKIRVVDHILNDILIKKALVKVLLPEAAEILRADLPFGFDRLENEKIYTSLTTFGRPTVIINGSNILENHIAEVTVEYLFSLGYLFRTPLVLILYLKSIFMLCIFLVHIKG